MNGTNYNSMLFENINLCCGSSRLFRKKVLSIVVHLFSLKKQYYSSCYYGQNFLGLVAERHCGRYYAVLQGCYSGL